MALVNGGFFALYGHREIHKKSSPKPLVRFEIISQECSLGDPFSNTVREILIRP